MATLALVGNNQYQTICAVYWVTEGAERCIVGRVSDEFKEFFPRLVGQVAQVVTIFPFSDKRKKIAYSVKNDGVMHVMLIDKLHHGDMEMNKLLQMVDDYSSGSSDDGE